VNYVALKMLYGDRAKYLMLLCGLPSPMLIVQQGSIFWGLAIWSNPASPSNADGQWIRIAQVDEVKRSPTPP
jgi:putative ABC transport system permease protein